MFIEKEFEQIDYIKNKGVQNQCISTCKSKIDKLYLNLNSEKIDNFDKILYERKTNLSLEQKWHSDIKWSFVMTVLGAFLGSYTSYIFTHFTNSILNFVNINYKETNPMQIIYSKDENAFLMVHLFLFVTLILGGITIIKKNGNKVDRQFYNDMSDYELQKIEIQLNKM